jgi:hypothetical protein
MTKVDKDFFVYEKIETRGFNPNKFYKADITEHLTIIDLGGGKSKAIYEQNESNMREISRGDYYLAKLGNLISSSGIFREGNDRGSQAGGIPLVSEFGGDGPKTDATMGADKPINTDLIMAAFNALGQSGEVLKFKMEDMPDWVSLAKDINESLESEKNKQNENKSPSNSPANTKTATTADAAKAAQQSSSLNNQTPRIQPAGKKSSTPLSPEYHNPKQVVIELDSANQLPDKDVHLWPGATWRHGHGDGRPDTLYKIKN